MLAQPIPFVIFLLLIVKSGMDAVSFAAKHAMRPSCLSCAYIIFVSSYSIAGRWLGVDDSIDCF